VRRASLAHLRHELRTPSTEVVGYAEMLIEGAREEGRDHLLPDLQRILDAARQLLGELDDMVRLSAPAAPNSAEGREMTRTTAMAQEVLAKLQPVSIVSAPDPDVGQASLLVVDDNPTNRDLLSRQVARQGFSVHTASHGREALERLGAEDFDLVLLDVMMPEIDGIEVLRRMKADPGLRDIPVIMISVLDEIDSVVRCIQLGPADYLTKPFDPVLLQARIGASLEVRRSAPGDPAAGLCEERHLDIDSPFVLTRPEMHWGDVLRRVSAAGVDESGAQKIARTGAVQAHLRAGSLSPPWLS
jgi:adenylate cyclase